MVEVCIAGPTAATMGCGLAWTKRSAAEAKSSDGSSPRSARVDLIGSGRHQRNRALNSRLASRGSSACISAKRAEGRQSPKWRISSRGKHC